MRRNVEWEIPGESNKLKINDTYTFTAHQSNKMFQVKKYLFIRSRV